MFGLCVWVSVAAVSVEMPDWIRPLYISLFSKKKGRGPMAFQEAEDHFWMEGDQPWEGILGLDSNILCPIIPLFVGLSHLRKDDWEIVDPLMLELDCRPLPVFRFKWLQQYPIVWGSVPNFIGILYRGTSFRSVWSVCLSFCGCGFSKNAWLN